MAGELAGPGEANGVTGGGVVEVAWPRATPLNPKPLSVATRPHEAVPALSECASRNPFESSTTDLETPHNLGLRPNQTL